MQIRNPIANNGSWFEGKDELKFGGKPKVKINTYMTKTTNTANATSLVFKISPISFYDSKNF